jgi:DinB family protein
MAGTPDPIAEAAAYRAMLLGLCGDDDPARVQSETPEILRGLVLEAEGHLRTRPAPGEWSVLELLGHIADAELVMSGRYRWVIAHDEPELPGYDQDLWVDRLSHNDGQPERLIRLFEALRAANVTLWGDSTPSQRARAALHSERGRETLDEMFHMIAGHDRFHLDQAQRTLGAVRASA